MKVIKREVLYIQVKWKIQKDKGHIQYCKENYCIQRINIEDTGKEKEIVKVKGYLKYLGGNAAYPKANTGQVKDLKKNKGHMKDLKESYGNQNGNTKDTGLEKEKEKYKGHMKYMNENDCNSKY